MNPFIRRIRQPVLRRPTVTQLVPDSLWNIDHSHGMANRRLIILAVLVAAFLAALACLVLSAQDPLFRGTLARLPAGRWRLDILAYV